MATPVSETRPPVRHRPLNPAQRRAVVLMAAGKKPIDISRELGLHEKTIFSWRNKPHFMAAVEAELQAFEAEAGEMLRRGLPKAVTNAERLQSCGVESVELGASKFFLEGFANLIKQRDQQKELDALKELVLSLQARLDGESAT
jgi:hypothetical protein